jgi:hypothetical protein
LFGSVFIKKKVTKPKLLFKKTETGSNRPVSVRFSLVFLEQKPIQTGLALFFGLTPFFFLIWLGFFRFGLGSVWFFFYFRLIKPKPNQTSRFFQNSNRVFFMV